MGHKCQLIEHPRGGEWGPSVRRLLDFLMSTVLSSVQVGEIMALVRLLYLVDRFEKKPSRSLYDEILLLAKQYGRGVRDWVKDNLSRSV